MVWFLSGIVLVNQYSASSNWPEISHNSLYFSASLRGKYLGEISQISLIDSIDCYIQINISVATTHYFKAKGAGSSNLLFACLFLF